MEFSFWVACVIGGVGKIDKVITGGASKALPERCKQKNPPFKKQRIPHIFTYCLLYKPDAADERNVVMPGAFFPPR